MPAMIHWQLRGAGGTYEGSAGAFIAEVRGIGRQAGIRWLHEVTPRLRDKAKQLSLPKRTGRLYNSIEDRYDDANLRSFYGSWTCPYALYQEVGFHMHGTGRWIEGKHYLTGALSSLKAGTL